MRVRMQNKTRDINIENSQAHEALVRLHDQRINVNRIGSFALYRYGERAKANGADKGCKPSDCIIRCLLVRCHNICVSSTKVESSPWLDDLSSSACHCFVRSS